MRVKLAATYDNQQAENANGADSIGAGGEVVEGGDGVRLRRGRNIEGTATPQGRLQW